MVVKVTMMLGCISESYGIVCVVWPGVDYIQLKLAHINHDMGGSDRMYRQLPLYCERTVVVYRRFVVSVL